MARKPCFRADGLVGSWRGHFIISCATRCQADPIGRFTAPRGHLALASWGGQERRPLDIGVVPRSGRHQVGLRDAAAETGRYALFLWPPACACAHYMLSCRLCACGSRTCAHLGDRPQFAEGSEALFDLEGVAGRERIAGGSRDPCPSHPHSPHHVSCAIHTRRLATGDSGCRVGRASKALAAWASVVLMNSQVVATARSSFLHASHGAQGGGAWWSSSVDDAACFGARSSEAPLRSSGAAHRWSTLR